MQHIGSHAFQECRNLASLTIGNDVESIGEYAFADCTSLAAITVDGNNPAYCSDANGVLYNKAKTTLVQYAHRAGYSGRACV